MNPSVASFEKRCQQLAQGFADGIPAKTIKKDERILQAVLEGPRLFRVSRRRPSLTVIRVRIVSSRRLGPISPAPSPEFTDGIMRCLSPDRLLSCCSSISLSDVRDYFVWEYIGFRDLTPFQAADCPFFPLPTARRAQKLWPQLRLHRFGMSLVGVRSITGSLPP